MVVVPAKLGPQLTADEVVAYVQQNAPAYGLDAAAVLAISEQEGLGNRTPGDGGHSFGPWQLNDAGGSMPAAIAAHGSAYEQAWAWSTDGIDYALQQIGGVAAGLQGAAAVHAIATNFERPAIENLPGEIARAIAALTRWYARLGQGAQVPGVTTPGNTSPGITDIPPQTAPPVSAGVQAGLQAGSFASAIQTLIAGTMGPALAALKIKPDVSGLVVLLASLFAILIGAIVWRGNDVKSAVKQTPGWIMAA